MKIHHRFLLFLVGSIVLYAGTLQLLRRSTERVGARLLATEVQEVADHMQQVMRLERAPMEKGIFDNTMWDDMVTFVDERDPEWAQENIEDAFPNFGLQFVWVYDVRLQPVYTMPAKAGHAGALPAPPADALRQAMAGGWFGHYFASGEDSTPVEYFIAPIQPTSDDARKVTPHGYLVGARLLDRAYLDRLADITGGEVSLQPWSRGAAPAGRGDAVTGVVESVTPLTDVAGAPLALLRVRQVNQGLALLRRSLDNYNLLYLGFAALNLALLIGLVTLWVRIPLRRLSDSMDRHDLEPVRRYLDARHEFGTLARLIRDFFAQREALVSEIEMRRQSEDRLREARDLADASARAKAEFLSVMSHELRTPLNAVIGFTSLLLDEQPRPDQVDHLTTLKHSGETLLALINDVLDFSKMDAGKLTLERREFDLRGLIVSLVPAFEHLAQAKGLAFNTAIAPDVPARVIGDPLRLSQLLSNLLANALKFTERGSAMLGVATAGSEADAVRIAFTVSDTGIGIPRDKQAAIFEVFTQADSDITRRYGGTGLGLSIVARLLALMGSRIEVESAPGQGSTFRFTLRFALAGEAAAGVAEEPVPRIDLSGRRVLVVEDNAVNRRLAVTILRKWGIEVDVAENGAVAVDKAMLTPYDAILMDLQMPQMGGVEATRRIRAQAGGPNIDTPILAFTATDDPFHASTLTAEGFQDVIIKPVEPERLRAILQRHLFPDALDDRSGAA